MNIKDLYIQSYIDGHGFAKKEAKNFRKASDWVLKGIYNAYRRDKAFRGKYSLDNIPTHILKRHGIERADQLSKRALRQAEFSTFKEIFNPRETYRGFSSFDTPSVFLRNVGNISPAALEPVTLPGSKFSGVVGGMWSPGVFDNIKVLGRMRMSPTQVLGHESGHAMFAKSHIYNMLYPRSQYDQQFARNVLDEYKRIFPRKYAKAVNKYSMERGSQISLDPNTRIRALSSGRKLVHDLHKYPFYDERLMDMIASNVSPADKKLNRAVLKHFNKMAIRYPDGTKYTDIDTIPHDRFMELLGKLNGNSGASDLATEMLRINLKLGRFWPDVF